MSDDQDWRGRMATASFRGFAFLTDAHEMKFGRRLVVHEFPGAEDPVVEDLGGKAWSGKLSAYFVGPDYDKERNGFLARLAEPGADWLTHPWLGYLWVRAQAWSVQERNDQGGYATVSIDFVPGGEQPFTSTVDRVDVAIDRSRQLGDVAEDDFALEAMSADGMTAFIAAIHGKLEALRQVIAVATLPLTWANQIRGLIAGIQGDLAALLAIPGAYATALRGLADAFGLGGAADAVADTDRPRLVARAVQAAASGRATVLSGVAATDGAVRRNLAREEALRRRLLVMTATAIALADYRAEADRDQALAVAIAALDALLPECSDRVFEAVAAARGALIAALRAQDLRPATVRDVAGPIPATVLAHRLRIDESVLRARNAVRHPLFVTGRVYG